RDRDSPLRRHIDHQGRDRASAATPFGRRSTSSQRVRSSRSDGRTRQIGDKSYGSLARERRESASMTLPRGVDGPLFPGSALGQRYRVDRPIGSGTMGTVYAAYDLPHDRPIALKVINRSHTADPTMVARFQREGRIIAGLRHPNIVNVLEVSQIDGDW